MHSGKACVGFVYQEVGEISKHESRWVCQIYFLVCDIFIIVSQNVENNNPTQKAWAKEQNKHPETPPVCHDKFIEAQR